MTMSLMMKTNPLIFIDSVDVVKVKTQCPEYGKYLANLNEHMKHVLIYGLLLKLFSEVGKVHSETKTTQCPHCDKFLANIKEHIQAVHIKENNYFCDLCDYETLFKFDL